MKISGAKAMIVGGASGMARATAEMLVREGATVAILDRPSSKGEEAAAAIGGGTRFYPCDVTDFAGTEATIRQAYVDRLEHEFANGSRLLRFGAPDLVAAAEAKLRGERVDPAVYTRAADGLRSQPGGEAIDTVVLACTHFPLVEQELAQAFGPGVRFVHGAAGIARGFDRDDRPDPVGPRRRLAADPTGSGVFDVTFVARR